jgi:hypothetical protein
MKNKISTIFLGVLLIFIWGNILKKIIYRLDDNVAIKTSYEITNNKNHKKVNNGDKFKWDNIVLDKNYKDPFIKPSKHLEKRLMKPVSHNLIIQPFKNQSSNLIKKEIKYFGLMKNNSANKVAILTLRKHTYTLGVNEKRDSICVLAITNDSVKVSVNHNSFWVTRNK